MKDDNVSPPSLLPSPGPPPQTSLLSLALEHNQLKTLSSQTLAGLSSLYTLSLAGM